MTDDAIDLGIDQLLGNDRAPLRIGAVIFGEQFELDLGTADFEILCVQLLDRELGAASLSLPRWACGPVIGAT